MAEKPQSSTSILLEDRRRIFGSDCNEASLLVNGIEYVFRKYGMFDSANWPKEAGIYVVSRTSYGMEEDIKLLVGKTSNFKNRWHQYRFKLKRGKYLNPYIQNSVNKHGLENFSFWKIETNSDEEDLGKREGFWYEYLTSDKDKLGWNINEPDANGITHLKSETKEKLRQINLGHKHTEDAKKKMSKSRSGHLNCNWGKIGPLHHMYGKKLSEERCKFLSDINSGEKNPAWGKKQTDENKRKRLMGNKKRFENSFKSPDGQIFLFLSVGDASKNIGVDRGKLGWFLKTAECGEILNGWTLLSYSGKKRKITRFTRNIRLKNCSTQNVVEERGMAVFARKYGLNLGRFRYFIIHAKIGDKFENFEKIEEYEKL